jgi:hypothetical protein
MNDADVLAALLERREEQRIAAEEAADLGTLENLTDRPGLPERDMGPLYSEGSTTKMDRKPTQEDKTKLRPEHDVDSHDRSAKVEPQPLPRLIYHRTTDETVSATLAAIENSRWTTSVRLRTCT